MSLTIEQCIAGLLTSNLENSTTEMGRSAGVAAESIVQRRGALDEVAAIALIFSDGIFVPESIAKLEVCSRRARSFAVG